MSSSWLLACCFIHLHTYSTETPTNTLQSTKTFPQADDIRSYRVLAGQHLRQPQNSRLAIEHDVPTPSFANACSVERVFSILPLVHSKRRNTLLRSSYLQDLRLHGSDHDYLDFRLRHALRGLCWTTSQESYPKGQSTSASCSYRQPLLPVLLWGHQTRKAYMINLVGSR